MYLDDKKKNDILKSAITLIEYFKKGLLGGAFMPEDFHPNLNPDSEEIFLYYTLPMSLNYQRNSYKLWESAKNTYEDDITQIVFMPERVLCMDFEQLKHFLIKYKVALQPNKQTEIWFKLCSTFQKSFNGSVKQLLISNDSSVEKIKTYILKNKKDFPYLSGPKIMNYWLYVLEQYTSISFIDREKISVAPDTHVLQASVQLGLINKEDLDNSDIRNIVSELWKQVFEDTDLSPIDIHTPLWLWSRNKFNIEVNGHGKQLYQDGL